MLLKTLAKIIGFLEAEQIEYMLFGGLANAVHGKNRQTLDIDLKLKLDISESLFIQKLKTFGVQIRTRDPISFIAATQVLPCQLDGIPIDFVFAKLDFETSAIARATYQNLNGFRCRVCRPDDLIIHKFISERDKDWFDIQGLINQNRAALDWKYILQNATEITEWLGHSQKLQRLINLKNAHRT